MLESFPGAYINFSVNEEIRYFKIQFIVILTNFYLCKFDLFFFFLFFFCDFQKKDKYDECELQNLTNILDPELLHNATKFFNLEYRIGISYNS